MPRCKVHGYHFTQLCMKCEARNNRYFVSKKAPNDISDDINIIPGSSFLNERITEREDLNPSPEPIIFDGGSSGGGGAERSWDSEPSSGSDSSDSFSSDSGSNDSGSCGGSDD